MDAEEGPLGKAETSKGSQGVRGVRYHHLKTTLSARGESCTA